MLSLLLYRIRSIYARSAFAWLTLVACPKYTNVGLENGQSSVVTWEVKNWWEDGLHFLFLGVLLVRSRSNHIRTLFPLRCVLYAYGAMGTEIRPTRILREFYAEFSPVSRNSASGACLSKELLHPMMALQCNFLVPLLATKCCPFLSEILIGRPLFVIWTHALPIINCMNEFRIPYLGMVYLSSIERLPFLCMLSFSYSHSG